MWLLQCALRVDGRLDCTTFLMGATCCNQCSGHGGKRKAC